MVMLVSKETQLAAISGYAITTLPRFRMTTLFIALLVTGLVIGASPTALAYDDRRDHDWSDEYWHHHHYGYWHGERGYWRYHNHKHEFIRVGPELSGFRARVADQGITFNAQYVAEAWGSPMGRPE
jgi:hypothetical protein